jgi:hypothetical protein
MPAQDSSKSAAAAAPLLTAAVKVNRKVNTSSGDDGRYSVDFGAAEDDRNGQWAPADQMPVFPLTLAVSREVGDALDTTKTYLVTITEA